MIDRSQRLGIDLIEAVASAAMFADQVSFP
jgi:hypothetical protein